MSWRPGVELLLVISKDQGLSRMVVAEDTSPVAHMPALTFSRGKASRWHQDTVAPAHSDAGTWWCRHTQEHRQGQRLPQAQEEKVPWAFLCFSFAGENSKKEKYFIFYTSGFFPPMLCPLSHPCWVSTPLFFARLALEGKTIKIGPDRVSAAPPRAVPSSQACEGDTEGLGRLSCLLSQDKKSHQSQKSFPQANCSPGAPQGHSPTQGRRVLPCHTQLPSQHHFKAGDADSGKLLLFPIDNSSSLTPDDF